MPIFSSEGGSVLFAHIPKTGGTAVENSFMAADYSAWLLQRTSRHLPPNALFRCSPQHMHATLLEAILDLEQLPLRVAVVRNPLSRFASEYLYRHRQNQELSENPDETHFTEWGHRVLDRRARNPFLLDNHLRPQEEFLLANTHVVRLEDGLSGVADLVTHWGLPAIDVGTRAATSKAPAESRIKIPDALEERLREVYAGDFRRFGYA